jgi:hypothetical protein
MATEAVPSGRRFSVVSSVFACMCSARVAAGCEDKVEIAVAAVEAVDEGGGVVGLAVCEVTVCV